MLRRARGFLVFLFSLSFLLFASQDASSAPLPKSTQEILKKLKLDPAMLDNIESEVQVPESWITKAREEGKLRIFEVATSKQMKAFLAPFKERYPFIDVKHPDSSRRVRTIKTLFAYKTGRILADIVVSVSSQLAAYKEADALEDLRSIPNMRYLAEGTKDPKGFWVGFETNYYCMAYNTKLVKKQELPKEWEDLINNPIWRDGNLALVNRPNLWAVQLWKTKGEKWTKNFLTQLLTEVKPQFRKEGLSAGLELTAAGEFHAVIPAVHPFTYQRSLAGAPVSFSCPEPVPSAVNDLIILKGAPNTYAAKVYINWLLSREGQLARYFARSASPVRKDLSRPEFIPFADQILGKEVSFRDPGLETKVLPALTEFWNNLWLRGGGALRRGRRR